MTSSRSHHGGAEINRSEPISFVFDGVEYEGFAGDTLASALLSHDVIGGFRSPILGRPRGVFSAGAEEPNAFVEVSEPWFEAIVPATTVELVDGLVATSRPGVGRLPSRQDDVPIREAEHRHAHVELLVIGGGHDGIHPAEEAARRGQRVLVVEREPRLPRVGMAREPAKERDGIRVMTRATALGLYDEGYAVVHERAGRVDRIWHVRAERVVLATGGFERPIAFADNDRPGVMLAGAAARYLAGFGVLVGERPVVFTARSPAYAVAAALAEAGADVAAIVDVREAASMADGPDVGRLAGWTVTGTDGADRVEAVHVSSPGGERRTMACDALLVSGGWNPNLTLWRSIGGGVRYDESTACFVPNGEGPPWLSIAGSAAGDVFADTPYWFVPAEDASHHFVDLQRDQTVADIAGAVDAGLRSVEHVKRATYIGTAVDQGRTSGVLTAAIVNAMLDEPGSQGPSNPRPPETPVPYAALAGPSRGALFDPVRTTAIHAWHVDHGGVFEDVGQWKRPRFFPRGTEQMHEAVERECLAVRNAVGAMDASTLGKVEVVGPDAPAFLDRMYTNRMSNLAVGSIRYGLMLGLDGMVLDDGVAMRLGEDRYLVTTTTGGAAVVLDRFEEWLQTEWPELRVFCTSVTEQWAVVAINGPHARDVVSAADADIDLSRDAFPFMTFRDGTVGGVPARIARVSFSGELAYELHVPGWFGLDVWEAVMAAGEPFGIEPYGTEAMHVLRAEKGYVIVGQDTDGSVTPADLGMDWIVNPSKGDFIGRRSLRRADLTRPDRKQLVGLFPDEALTVLPEGAQLVFDEAAEIPMPLAGHVTSSYRSAALGRSFALAMLAGGHGLHGRTVYAPLRDRTVACTVTSPVPYDPDGGRRDG